MCDSEISTLDHKIDALTERARLLENDLAKVVQFVEELGPLVERFAHLGAQVERGGLPALLGGMLTRG